MTNSGNAAVGGLFDLTGQVAVITGSSRGIGRAIAQRMAQHGAKVVISSRKQAACDAAAQDINDLYGDGRAVAIAASLSDKASLLGLAERVQDMWGRIDILVCCAATNPYYGPMSAISDEAFRKVMDNNVIANHWLIQAVAPGMRARRDGSIIVISSIGGYVGSPVIGAYNISKAADMQLARNLATEFGGDNVRVNCIAPGLVRTGLSRAIVDDPKSLQFYLDTTPLKRIAEPDDIAGAAVFLASPASAFVTGQTMVVDGGVTIRGV
ncbi:SDR family oxidoreductase [Azospirillum sp. B21]|uniref:SDR family NAD(P)-dependent oxidoreductase n=1 Tax=Azospirillum sp. B21 TaxID=2607496 RepID=UPI0011F081C1|nr:SDR family oxidoreductase [Azospirillum sp. B21]KAA0571221.1 SDR family oxidoreductase [Azospirillum sp. B21]